MPGEHSTLLLDQSGTITQPEKKKISDRIDLFCDLFSLPVAGLSIASTTTDGGLTASLGLLATLYMTLIWNGGTVAKDAAELPELIRNAKQKPTAETLFKAGSASIYSLLILGGVTLVSTAYSISDAYEKCSNISADQCKKNVIFSAEGEVGNHYWLMMCNAVYGGSCLLSVLTVLLFDAKKYDAKTLLPVASNLSCFAGEIFGFTSMMFPQERILLYLSAALITLYSLLAVGARVAKSETVPQRIASCVRFMSCSRSPGKESSSPQFDFNPAIQNA